MCCGDINTHHTPLSENFSQITRLPFAQPTLIFTLDERPCCSNNPSQCLRDRFCSMVLGTKNQTLLPRFRDWQKQPQSAVVTRAGPAVRDWLPPTESGAPSNKRSEFNPKWRENYKFQNVPLVRSWWAFARPRTQYPPARPAAPPVLSSHFRSSPLDQTPASAAFSPWACGSWECHPPPWRPNGDHG